MKSGVAGGATSSAAAGTEPGRRVLREPDLHAAALLLLDLARARGVLADAAVRLQCSSGCFRYCVVYCRQFKVLLSRVHDISLKFVVYFWVF